MKKLIEKIKNYKLNRYRKDIEKYENMSEDELEVEYINVKMNDRFLKLLGIILLVFCSLFFQSIKATLEIVNMTKLAFFLKDQPFELTDKFNHGDPIMALLITILLFLLIMGIIYNGLINIREMIIIEKVRSKKS
jgi:hypothetical protein